MFDPPVAPPYPEAPTVPRAQTGRYVYLVTRLRNRQITMEEATELFAIQQAMIRQASAAPVPRPPPTPTVAPTRSAAAPVAAPSADLSDETLWTLLLALGAGAGLLAAVGKRFRDGGPSPPSRTSGPVPPTK